MRHSTILFITLLLLAAVSLISCATRGQKRGNHAPRQKRQPKSKAKSVESVPEVLQEDDSSSLDPEPVLPTKIKPKKFQPGMGEKRPKAKRIKAIRRNAGKDKHISSSLFDEGWL